MQLSCLRVTYCVLVRSSQVITASLKSDEGIPLHDQTSSLFNFELNGLFQI